MGTSIVVQAGGGEADLAPALALGGLALRRVEDADALSAALAAADVVALAENWPAGLAPVLELVRTRRPLLPVVVVSRSQGHEAARRAVAQGAEDWIDLDRESPLAIHLALSLPARPSMAPACGRMTGARRIRRHRLLARLRPGLMTGLNEMLTVVLSHADLLQGRLGEGAVRSRLAQVSDEVQGVGQLLRQAHSFATRQQAVPTELVTHLQERLGLLSALVIAPVAFEAGAPSWSAVGPAEVDRLFACSCLSLGPGALRIAIMQREREIAVVLRGTLGRRPDPAWLALARGAEEQGVRILPTDGGIDILLPRERDATGEVELLPHPASKIDDSLEVAPRK